MGIMFGGVTDEDKHEETLESVFHNDMYGYQIGGNGKWVSMLLKKPKQEKWKKKKTAQTVPVKQKAEREGSDYEGFEDEDEVGNLMVLRSCGLIKFFTLLGERFSFENTKVQTSPRTAGGRPQRSFSDDANASLQRYACGITEYPVHVTGFHPICPGSRLNLAGCTDTVEFLNGGRRSTRSMISTGCNWIKWTGTFV